MIKEEKKNKKPKKTFKQILTEYLRTVAISVLAAFIFTTVLSFHAREVMIKNIYAEKHPPKIDEKIAKQLVEKSDYIKTLESKSYDVCINVGNIYEMAKDYPNAEYAYRLAVKKASKDNFVPHYKLAQVLISQERFDEANELLDSVLDTNNRALIKLKTRTYIMMGDKYFSIGKFLRAVRAYEKAKFYYDKFIKQDKVVAESIIIRITRAYDEAAGVVLRNGLNSDAVKLLKKAEALAPDDTDIKYKLAIVYTDLDPELAVKYFESLTSIIPQYIDYDVYNRALMKSANIADLEGRPVDAKYYRYKIHSKDLFLNRKVIYKDDVDVLLQSFIVKKVFFRYRLKPSVKIRNVSPLDIYKMNADFVLMEGTKEKQRVSVKCVTRQKPLYSNGGETEEISVSLGNDIYTKKELSDYTVELYLYKDEKFKTLVSAFKVPKKTTYLSK